MTIIISNVIMFNADYQKDLVQRYSLDDIHQSI